MFVGLSGRDFKDCGVIVLLYDENIILAIYFGFLEVAFIV